MSVLFEGTARVYLQGRNALLPLTSTENNDQIQYFIGNESTNLVIRDHRNSTIQEAYEAIRLRNQNGFAKLFNQYAIIKINYDENNNHMEIDLLEEAPPLINGPVLWMGILENNVMPGYDVEWEVFKPIDENNTAFIAFISQAI